MLIYEDETLKWACTSRTCWQDTRMTVEMSDDQLERLIATLQGGGGCGPAGTAVVAAVVGPMGPCILGNDKLKRPKKWTDRHKDFENKMSFLGITDSVQKMNFLRSCAGAELTEFWEKEVRVLLEATREGEVDMPAHTYKQVVENTKLTLLKLVSIDLLRMEQGSEGFMDFLADIENQMHLCHSWETLISGRGEMVRTGILGGGRVSRPPTRYNTSCRQVDPRRLRM